MPTDRELEQITLQRSFTPPDMRGTPMPTAQDALAFISRLRDVVPDAPSNQMRPTTPTTTAPRGTATRIPEQEQLGELYHTVKDASDQEVTILSTNGQLRSDADFGKALKNHNAGEPTPGFVVQPKGSYSEGIRKGLYQGTREALPEMGQAVGGAIPSKMLELAVKAGIVSPRTQYNAEQTGATAGRAIADFVGKQIDTPGEVGMVAGTALAAPFAAPVVGATGMPLWTSILGKNPVLFGAAGFTGSTGAKALTGEDQTAGKALEEFGAAALGGGLQGLVSYTLTKMLKPATATKVATEMMDAIKKKYPTLINDPNAFSIANATPKDISNLTSMMSKGLRGDAADEAETLLTSLKSALPSAPTVAQQNILRAHNRRIIESQTKALDNIGNETAFTEATAIVNQRKEELMQAVRDMFPGKKNFVATEAVLARHRDYVETFREGAQVLHHLKQSGAADKFNPIEFAQRIRGPYTDEPNSLLNQIGTILGQGRSLKDLPLPGEAMPWEEMGKKAFNLMRQIMPKGTDWTQAMKYTGPPTPWPTPAGPPTSQVIAAQQAGQAAMKSFLNRKEQPEGSVQVRIEQ